MPKHLLRLALTLAGLALLAGACTPYQVQVSYWLKSDGAIQLSHEQASDVADLIAYLEAKEAARRPRLPSSLVAIASCESGRGVYGQYSYTAKNPRSSASGRFQFINSTWSYVARSYASTWQAKGWESLRQEAASAGSARSARPAVQDAAAIVLLEREGTRPWSPSRGCWSRWV